MPIKEKRFVVKPKNPKLDKYWDQEYHEWDDPDKFSPSRHMTSDPDYADGKMCEDASRVDPETNNPVEKPIPVRRVDVDVTERD